MCCYKPSTDITIPLAKIKNMLINITKRDKKTIQIHYELDLGYDQIYKNLRKLERQGLVKREGYKNSIIWKSIQGLNHLTS